jgi:nucleoside-diphosphate-sugar epimerase
MSGSQVKHLVIGGGSRIARVLSRILDPAPQVVQRRLGEPHANYFLVDSYDYVPAGAFVGATCVINCVGISKGDEASFNHVNVELPFRIAEMAKAAGVRQMIHISSFSVYGHAKLVSASTATAPSSAYGWSKLCGDERLLTLADEHFAMSILRLPLVYGGGSNGKLERLMRWWMRLCVLPVPIGDVSRAMIGVDLAAEVIAALSHAPRPGIFLAADPHPFAYATAARASGNRLACLPIPRVMTDLVERAVPAIGTRLFADSRLDDIDNLAVEYGLVSRLVADIEKMLAS